MKVGDLVKYVSLPNGDVVYGTIMCVGAFCSIPATLSGDDWEEGVIIASTDGVHMYVHLNNIKKVDSLLLS